MQRDNGPKLAEAAPEGSIERPQPGPNGFYIASLGPNGFPARIPGVPGVCVLGNGARAQWYRITVTELSNNLISRAGKPIEDATGLKGLYDVSLYWVMNPRPDIELSGPDLFEALQQQLGLKLHTKKITIQIVVVDHAAKAPTEN